MVEMTRNKRFVKRLYDEVITAGKIEVLEELVAEDAAGFGQRGRAAFFAHVRALRTVVAAARATVTDLVAEGLRVVVFWKPMPNAGGGPLVTPRSISPWLLVNSTA
jgi:hypothetical protein